MNPEEPCNFDIFVNMSISMGTMMEANSNLTEAFRDSLTFCSVTTPDSRNPAAIQRRDSLTLCSAMTPDSRNPAAIPRGGGGGSGGRTPSHSNCHSTSGANETRTGHETRDVLQEVPPPGANNSLCDVLCDDDDEFGFFNCSLLPSVPLSE